MSTLTISFSCVKELLVLITQSFPSQLCSIHQEDNVPLEISLSHYYITPRLSIWNQSIGRIVIKNIQLKPYPIFSAVSETKLVPWSFSIGPDIL